MISGAVGETKGGWMDAGITYAVEGASPSIHRAFPFWRIIISAPHP